MNLDWRCQEQRRHLCACERIEPGSDGFSCTSRSRSPRTQQQQLCHEARRAFRFRRHARPVGQSLGRQEGSSSLARRLDRRRPAARQRRVVRLGSVRHTSIVIGIVTSFGYERGCDGSDVEKLWLAGSRASRDLILQV